VDLYIAPRWHVSRPQGTQTWITQCNLQTTPCPPLAFVRIHQMAPPRTMVTTASCSLLLIYRPRKDERLRWPSWLIYSGRFSHISGHPSAVGGAQDSESSPVKDQCSTAEPRNQPYTMCMYCVLRGCRWRMFWWMTVARTFSVTSVVLRLDS